MTKKDLVSEILRDVKTNLSDTQEAINTLGELDQDGSKVSLKEPSNKSKLTLKKQSQTS